MLKSEEGLNNNKEAVNHACTKQRNGLWGAGVSRDHQIQKGQSINESRGVI